MKTSNENVKVSFYLKKNVSRIGRKPKNDKINYRYTVNFTEMENAKCAGKRDDHKTWN